MTDAASLIPAAVPRPSGRARRRLGWWAPLAGRAGIHLVLVGLAIAFSFPFVWMLSSSLKSARDVFLFPPAVIPWPMHPENYRYVWDAAPFGRYAANSLIAAAGAVALQALTISTAAYAFARLRFPFRGTIFVFFLGAMMVPAQVTVIPSFVLLSTLGWVDTYWALTLPFGASAFGTFLVRQAFLGVPSELTENAQMDGASHLCILWRIMVPLAFPTILSFLLVSFTWRWNDYLWPLIMTTSPDMRTLPLGLVHLRGMEGYLTWHVLMAGTMMAVAPLLVLFLVAQRQLVEGIARTGITGW
jgi:ABC-type glycerol-3-phosphate transport system permease component